MRQEADLSAVHSLYSDLFLTGIRENKDSLNQQTKQTKESIVAADLELERLRRVNLKLNVNLSRYKKVQQGVVFPEITRGQSLQDVSSLRDSVLTKL